MTNNKNKPSLIFENSFDLRAKLKEVYQKGGLDELKKYIDQEFVSDRTLQINDETSFISDVQLRYLDDGKPGKIIMDYKNDTNTTNSMLLMTANLIDIDSKIQLLIRKKL